MGDLMARRGQNCEEKPRFCGGGEGPGRSANEGRGKAADPLPGLPSSTTRGTDTQGGERALKKATTTMKKIKSGAKGQKARASPSQQVDARTKEPADWRGETLARVRALIQEADPNVLEEVKWR